ncbi:DUF58 domain-containing protein [Pseudomonas sp. BC115LW]|nr:DUF58 domain-containing protein [Pseudomonas sp. BC115LW]NBB35137.1 DUF58 domain-containing protein [Pseudomonas sp. BC115LW]
MGRRRLKLMSTLPWQRTAPTAVNEEGIYVDLAHLVALRTASRGLSLLPQPLPGSLLAGAHDSRLRGRGLNFEELRAYWPGDDARLIDWQVTARLRKPFIRQFAEERDRPLLLLVDQRMNQFFGSQRAMKSVLAAELAALAGWIGLAQQDRVGALIFGDTLIDELRPNRGSAYLLQTLKVLVRHNRALSADLQHDAPEQLNQVLRRAIRLARHGHLILLISDFHGLDEQTHRLLAELDRHNDVIACWSHDPLLAGPLPSSRLVVSQGERQMTVDLGHGTQRRGLEQLQATRLEALHRSTRQLGIPLLPISSAAPCAEQLHRLLGQLTARQTRP